MLRAMGWILNSNNLKSFFLKLLAFFIIIFFCDIVIGNILKEYYFKQKSGYDYQTSLAINQTTADIIILGSSRAVNIFNSNILENRLKMTCYNAGRNGHPLFYHYAVLKAILKRKIPKIVILSFDAKNFSIDQDAYDRLSTLLPFYQSHPEIKEIIELKSKFEKIKNLSAIYPYNSLLLPILNGNRESSKEKYKTVNGYYPLVGTMVEPLGGIKFDSKSVLDSIKVNTFKNLIYHCKQSGIKLYVVCTPYLIQSTEIDHSITEAKKIARENNINFFDFSQDTFYTKKPYLFADFRHLNEAGVQIFSNKIADMIK